ncbi:DUF1269 domain-containing protein [Catenulispora yoronensis]|uniref:DUF1269 domain-containing protein n=1 Tax=Catenulispora yoronensis TaxID=450799 RepID=UPI0031DCD255
MATLTVWKFHEADGAEKLLGQLEQMQKQELVSIKDGAVVAWPEQAKKPKTRQLSNLTGSGALGGAFWGLLFGLIFFVPLLGAAIGAAAGALGGSMADVGISKDFIEQVKAKIKPGTSALFLLTQDAVADRVKPAFEGAHAELISTNLSAEQEAQLRAAFSEDESYAAGAADAASAVKSGAVKAGAVKPGAVKPGAAKPGVAKPGPAKPAEAGAKK